MTAPAIGQAFGAAAITAARQPGQRPDADPCVLCIYGRTDKFVYWLAACRLPSASCPGCQRREPAGGQVVLPDGRPAHGLPEPCSRLNRLPESGGAAHRILADGQIAQFAAIASVIGAGLLLILSGLSLVHERRGPAQVEVLAQSVHTTAVTA